MGIEKSENEIEKEIQGVIDAIYKIAESIQSGKADITVVDEELLEALLETGYGIDEEEPKEDCLEIEKHFLNLYRGLMCEPINRSVLLGELLYVLGANVKHIQSEKLEWTKLLQSLMDLVPKSVKNKTQGLYDVREMVMQQCNEFGQLERWDMVVRYLAIEDYFGKNNCGFELYRKMQAARNGEGYVEGAENVYRSLIASFEQNGYDSESSIVCDANLKLFDGSHRMALCLYYDIPQIKVTMRDSVSNIQYGEKWFAEHGFTDEEMCVIRNKSKELVDKCRQPFVCILWPPAAPLFDEITEEIGKLYPIIEQEDYSYSEETFTRLVWGVYHIDDIADWKVEKKLSYMAGVPTKTVRVLKVEVNAPKFRLKASTNQTLSQAGEQLKYVIRTKFKDRIDNYFYDIIIHTGDNFKQNIYMEKLFRQAFSLREYLARIVNDSYYIMKKDAPYQTPDFPNTYAFSKDLDIVCAREDFRTVVHKTREFLRDSIEGYELIEIDKEDNCRTRVELNGYLIFQIDISVGVSGLTEEFVRESIEKRKFVDGYYLPEEKDELCIRAVAYQTNPRKRHHLEYIRAHADRWESDYVEKHLQDNIQLMDELKCI